MHRLTVIRLSSKIKLVCEKSIKYAFKTVYNELYCITNEIKLKKIIKTFNLLHETLSNKDSIKWKLDKK